MIHQLVIVPTSDGVTFIYRLIFLIAIILVLITEFFGYRIQNVLWERDSISQNYIRPRLYGIILRLSFSSFLLVAIILMIIDRNDTFLILLLVVFSVTSFLCIDTYATKLTYSDTFIYYVRYKRERVISWKEVENIRWEQAPKEMGLMLVIYLQNGEKITLRQSIFVGLRQLETMYKLK